MGPLYWWKQINLSLSSMTGCRAVQEVLGKHLKGPLCFSRWWQIDPVTQSTRVGWKRHLLNARHHDALLGSWVRYLRKDSVATVSAWSTTLLSSWYPQHLPWTSWPFFRSNWALMAMIPTHVVLRWCLLSPPDPQQFTSFDSYRC